MSGVQVSRGQTKIITPLLGYTVEESSDLLEYATGQNVGGRRRALDVMPHGVYELSTGNLVAVGSTTRIIKKVAHGALKNDFIFFTTGLNVGLSIQILSVPDADNMIIASTFENAIAIGDAFTLHRSVVPLYSSNGGLTVSSVVGGATEEKQGIIITDLGSVTEAAPVTDIASSGLNGRLQRIAQRITSLIALLPASLGVKADTASLAITASNEDVARSGIITEAAPATDTASSGLNGRLQRIAQRITSLIALLPTALGQGTMATSLKVVLPSDQSTLVVAQAGLIPTYAQSLVIADSGVITFTKPANAKKVLIMAGDANTVILKVTVDGTTTPTATVGMDFIASRSLQFDGVADVKVTAATAATGQSLFLHWSV